MSVQQRECEKKIDEHHRVAARFLRVQISIVNVGEPVEQRVLVGHTADVLFLQTGRDCFLNEFFGNLIQIGRAGHGWFPWRRQLSRF